MFWSFFITIVFGFLCGIAFVHLYIYNTFSFKERVYLNSFYKALKEGKYREEEINMEDDE